MAVADLAANILVKNRLSPMFLGKFYDYTSSYSKEGKRIIMQIKGGQLSRPVDDIDDLKLVESTDAYLIYTNELTHKIYFRQYYYEYYSFFTKRVYFQI